MRWLRRRHRHRIVTGYDIAWHPVYGWYERVIYRGCICQSPFLKPTPPRRRTMKIYQSEAERLWRKAAMWSYISIGFAAIAVAFAIVSAVTR